MAVSRVFVCDPRCVEPLGADVDALKYFSESLGRHFPKVIPVCCKFLPDKLVKHYGFLPYYDFYYDRYVKIERPPGAVSPLRAAASLEFIDPVEAAATADAERLLTEYNVGESDMFFFPSTDFYGAIGLLNALTGSQRERRPLVLMRFIGVSEHGSPSYREPLVELANRILLAKAAGVRLSFSAETPKYADHLAELLECEVVVTPYLDVTPAHPISEDGPFVFLCPGSARGDKGFMQLFELYAGVRRRDPDLKIRFVTQNLPHREEIHHQDYVSQLYSIPGVTLLPPWLTEEEILSQYRNCSAVLLPYDRATYAYRGSAVMMIGACFGRPAITLDGTAFSEQVRYYNLGVVVSTLEEMVNAMIAMAQQPRSLLERRAKQGRMRFLKDSLNAYNQWLEAGKQ